MAGRVLRCFRQSYLNSIYVLYQCHLAAVTVPLCSAPPSWSANSCENFSTWSASTNDGPLAHLLTFVSVTKPNLKFSLGVFTPDLHPNTFYSYLPSPMACLMSSVH